MPKFSYSAKRFPGKVSIAIDSGSVDWAYSRLGNSWQFNIPLSSLEPYPTYIQNHSGQHIVTSIFPIVVFAFIIAAAIWGWTTYWVIAALLVGMAFLLWIAAIQFIGPIRWASFGCEYTGKDVGFFQGNDKEEFEQFAKQMTTLILDARLVEKLGSSAVETSDV